MQSPLDSSPVLAPVPRRRLVDLLALLGLLASIGLSIWIAWLGWSISPLFGFIGFLVAPVLGGFIAWAWSAVSRPQRSQGMPGQIACPACASLQTDREEVPTADGGAHRVMRCFVCEHRWT